MQTVCSSSSTAAVQSCAAAGTELSVDELVLGQVEEEHQVQHQQVEAEAENAAKEGEGQEKGGCAGERLQLCFSRQMCEGGTCPGYA